MSDRPELLPCPFCGNAAKLEELGDHHGEYFNLGCFDRNCPAHHVFYTEIDTPKELAIATWNRRADLRAAGIREMAMQAVERGEADIVGAAFNDKEPGNG